MTSARSQHIARGRFPNCLGDGEGSDGWAMTPSGTRGVVNDAMSIYFADAILANAFVARCLAASKAQPAYSGCGSHSRNGVFSPDLLIGGNRHDQRFATAHRGGGIPEHG